MRVSRSGGWTSVMRPHSNRLRMPVLEGRQLLGRDVAGDDDLLVRVVQGVERVEELLLRLHLALEELDVVDEQDVDVAVAALERRRLVVADGVDEVVRELLRAHVAHAAAVVEAAGVVPDRVQEVGLAQPALAVDEQRVVRLRRRLGHGDGGGVREPVARADDEGVERVLVVEPALLGVAPRARLAGPGADARFVDVARGGRLRRTARVPRLVRGGGHGVELVGEGRVGDLVGEVLERTVLGLGAAAGCVRVDGHGDRDLAAQLGGQRLGQRRAQPVLDHVAGELVGRRDDHRVADHGHRTGQAQEGAVLRGDVVQPGERAAPDLPQVVRLALGGHHARGVDAGRRRGDDRGWRRRHRIEQRGRSGRADRDGRMHRGAPFKGGDVAQQGVRGGGMHPQFRCFGGSSTPSSTGCVRLGGGPPEP